MRRGGDRPGGARQRSLANEVSLEAMALIFTAWRFFMAHAGSIEHGRGSHPGLNKP